MTVDFWNNDEAFVLVDTNPAWSSRFDLRFGDDRCGAPSSWGQGADGPAEADSTVAHSSDTATVRITTNVDRGDEWWGIQDVHISLMTPMPSPPNPPSPPGTWGAAVSDRWPGAMGWSIVGATGEHRWEGREEATGWAGTSGDAMTTNCGALGTAFGGYAMFGAGTYVEKTFMGLDSHSSLRIQFTFFKVPILLSPSRAPTPA